MLGYVFDYINSPNKNFKNTKLIEKKKISINDILKRIKEKRKKNIYNPILTAAVHPQQ